MASSENDRAGAPLTRRQMRERAASQETAQDAGPTNAGQQQVAPLSRRAMREHSLDQDARESVAQRPAAAVQRPAQGGQAAAAPAPQRPAGPAAPAQRPAAGRPQQAPQPTQAPQARPSVMPAAGAPAPGAPVRPPVQRPAAAEAPAPRGVRAPVQQRQAPVAAPQPQQQRPLPQRPVEPPSRSAQAAARTQAERAAAQARPQQAPVVAPPPVTGAVRRIDGTGRLTPAVAVSSGGVPVVEPDPRAASGQPSRVGVRDAVAKAQQNTAPRVYPAGTTPYPAEPNQPSRLSSQTARPAGRATPAPYGSVAPAAQVPARQAPVQQAPAQARAQQGWAPAAAGQPAAGAGQQAAPGPQFAPVQAATPGHQPAPAQPAAPAQPSAVGYSAAAPLPASFQPAAGSDDEPGVPSWDAVLGGGSSQPVADASPFSPVAAPEQPGEEIDEEPVTNDSWLGYTPFHYVILVVIGLVLGFVCWQLLSATSDSAAKAAPAMAAVVQGASPGSA